MRKTIIIFILSILFGQTYGQNKKLSNFGYSAYGEFFNRYVEGKKEGVWIERDNNIAAIGSYRNNKKDSIWQYYNLSTGELLKEKNYSKDSRRIRAFFGTSIKMPNDTLVHIEFDFLDKTVSKDHGTWQTSPKLNDIKISIVNIKDSSDKNFKILDYAIALNKNRIYKITFSKNGYISKSINVNTIIPKWATKEEADTISEKHISINMSNRVSDNDPLILGKVSNIYQFGKNAAGLRLLPDNWYLALQKRKLNGMDEFEKKQKIIEIENSVNEQILNLKEEQLLLENQKRLKEEELRHQEDEIKRKQLELELLAKDKAVSDLTIKAKEAELLKNVLLANEKKKEIDNLNQQRLIQELTIKNNESELNQKNIETANKQKQIQGLEKEKTLSEENIKQQKFIQKLMLAGSGLLAIFLVFVFFSLSKSRKANKLIALQQAETEKQKHLVEEKQKEIIESISYAKRLQDAILPPQDFVNAHLKNNFIYYQPKDIVAGDFYWAEKVGELFFIAAADSTGHGVPGAMVSVVCSNALNRAIKEFKLTETGKILDKTRDLVIETFEKSTSEVKDGMDISLLCIDSNNKNIYWSGANNPLWYIQDNELKEIKADKQPIGKTDYPKPFTTHQIEFKENTTFYLFTDGLADQFGGPKGKKFKYKQFSDLLIKNNHLSQKQQSEIINKNFIDWKGDLEQVDDVCVIGIKI